MTNALKNDPKKPFLAIADSLETAYQLLVGDARESRDKCFQSPRK